MLLTTSVTVVIPFLPHFGGLFRLKEEFAQVSILTESMFVAFVHRTYYNFLVGILYILMTFTSHVVLTYAIA